MQRGTTEMDRELPVKLNADEVNERAETMATKLIHIGSLRKKRREDLRSVNALIESELDEVQRLARTIIDGVEQRKQADLRFGDEVVPSATEATAALAKVAEIAEVKRWHRDGALCRGENCRKRIHVMDPEALRANGIVVEGDEPFEGQGEHEGVEPEADGISSESDEDPRPRCSGCGEVLSALEVVKKLGLCEPCQMQPHENVDLPPAEDEAISIFEHEEREREAREASEQPTPDNA